MRQREHRPESERSGIPTLDRTVAIALLGMGLIYLFQSLLVWLVRGVVLLPFLVSALLALVVIGLIVERRSFASGLGALVALAPVVTALTEPLVSSALLHPASNLAFFGILIVQFACAVIAGVLGVAAVIQHARPASGIRPAFSPRSCQSWRGWQWACSY